MQTRYSGGSKEIRRTRRKFDDAAGLSITSLLDVLTIILVFLIKNVSMEAQKVSIPDNMYFPTTITNEKLIENAGTMVVKMYPYQILVGTESIPLVLWKTSSPMKPNASTSLTIYSWKPTRFGEGNRQQTLSADSG
jgi:hypothetical protein